MNCVNYSIIIPHKNTPILLKRCIDSIPQRNDLEIIIVDDNSDPNIVDFDAFPGSRRSDTKIVFSKAGKGAGFARNIGLDYSQGSWLLFADSDDFFLDSINSILNDYKKSKADIVYFNSKSVFSDTLEPASRHTDISNLVNNYIESYPDSEKKIRYMYYYPYSKLVKKELVRSYNIKFDEIKVTNDVWFAVLIGHYAETILVDQRSLYCLTVREDSLSKTPGESIFDIRVETNLKVHRFMKQNKINDSHHPMLTYIFQARKYGVMKVFNVTFKSVVNGTNIFSELKQFIEKKATTYIRRGK